MLDPWWHNVFLLIYGYALIDDPEYAKRYLHWLSSQSAERPERLAGRELAGAALLEVDEPQSNALQSQAELLLEAIVDTKLSAPATVPPLAPVTPLPAWVTCVLTLGVGSYRMSLCPRIHRDTCWHILDG